MRSVKDIDIENLSLTEEALIVVMNWSAITSTYSSGGVTADKINNTPELYIVTSLLSLSSVIFKISGLDLISTRLKGKYTTSYSQDWYDIWEYCTGFRAMPDSPEPG